MGIHNCYANIISNIAVKDRIFYHIYLFNRRTCITTKGVKEPITLSCVCGIGEPYNVRCGVHAEKPRELGKEYEISFFHITDKHTSNSAMKAYVTAVSNDCAEIKTDAPLALFDNVEIDIGEKLFAKVVKIADGKAEIRFTSKPECFGEWLKKLN